MNTHTTTGQIRRDNARRLVARLEAKPYLTTTQLAQLTNARRRAAA